jgi:hypothetical protein
MSAAQVPLWVPLVVALLGIAGVLSAQILASRREDKRWLREQQREDLRWQRDRQREREERDYRSRLDAYGRVISALETWAWALYPARKAVIERAAVLDESQRAELSQLRDLMQDALGPMNLLASDDVRELMRLAVNARADFTASLLRGGVRADELRAQWKLSIDTYVALRTAMRRDLAVDLPE